MTMTLVQNHDGHLGIITENWTDSQIYIWLCNHKSYDERSAGEANAWCGRLTDHIIGKQLLSRAELAEAHREVGSNIMEIDATQAQEIQRAAMNRDTPPSQPRSHRPSSIST